MEPPGLTGAATNRKNGGPTSMLFVKNLTKRNNLAEVWEKDK